MLLSTSLSERLTEMEDEHVCHIPKCARQCDAHPERCAASTPREWRCCALAWLRLRLRLYAEVSVWG